MTAADCPLCREDGGAVVVKNALLRVVLVDDTDDPGFVRVIVDAHVRETTDLDAATRARVMAAVYAVEDALRAVLAPDKVNLASPGNACRICTGTSSRALPTTRTFRSRSGACVSANRIRRGSPHGVHGCRRPARRSARASGRGRRGAARGCVAAAPAAS